MFEPPDPFLPTMEQPPPEELDARSMEPPPEVAGEATPTGSTRTLLSCVAFPDGLPPGIVIVTVFPSRMAPGTAWNPLESAWYTLLPGGKTLGKVIVIVAVPPEAMPSARNETMPSRNSYPSGAPVWFSRAMPSEIATADLMNGAEPVSGTVPTALVEVDVMPVVSICISPVPVGDDRDARLPLFGWMSTESGDPSSSESGVEAMVVNFQTKGAERELPAAVAMVPVYSTPLSRGQFGMNVPFVWLLSYRYNPCTIPPLMQTLPR